jgi:hypothetical protein
MRVGWGGWDQQIPPGSLRSRVGMTKGKQIPPASLRSPVGMTKGLPAPAGPVLSCSGSQ